MRLLIVRLGAVGDIVHALPVAAALRHRFPEATIDWAVDERYADLLDLVPVVGPSGRPRLAQPPGRSRLAHVPARPAARCLRSRARLAGTDEVGRRDVAERRHAPRWVRAALPARGVGALGLRRDDPSRASAARHRSQPRHPGGGGRGCGGARSRLVVPAGGARVAGGGPPARAVRSARPSGMPSSTRMPPGRPSGGRQSASAPSRRICARPTACRRSSSGDRTTKRAPVQW